MYITICQITFTYEVTIHVYSNAVMYVCTYILPYEWYSTAHIQVYKQTRVMRRASRNFVCNSLVGLVQHEEYTAGERLLMS